MKKGVRAENDVHTMESGGIAGNSSLACRALFITRDQSILQADKYQ
jgi:hypothetical protein